MISRPGGDAGAPAPLPPRRAGLLLHATLPAGIRGLTIIGDLAQEYEEHAARHGRGWLWLWYWLQAVDLGMRYALRGRPAAAATRRARRRARRTTIPRLSRRVPLPHGAPAPTPRRRGRARRHAGPPKRTR